MHDIEQALNALETVVKGRETHVHTGSFYFSPTSGRCIVGEALYSVGVTDQRLALMSGFMIDYLYENTLLPIPMTLGAVAVYRAAQRAQDGLVSADTSWGNALNAAITTAGRFMDLMPDSVVRAATTTTETLVNA